MSDACTGGQSDIHWLLGHNADCVPAVAPLCERCHGTGVDPEHVATEDYGDTTREVSVPCEGCCPDMTESVPDHLYHESCPGICCGGNEEL